MLHKCYEKGILEDLIVSFQEKRRILKDQPIIQNIFYVALDHLTKAMAEIDVYELFLNRHEMNPADYKAKLVQKMCDRY